MGFYTSTDDSLSFAVNDDACAQCETKIVSLSSAPSFLCHQTELERQNRGCAAATDAHTLNTHTHAVRRTVGTHTLTSIVQRNECLPAPTAIGHDGFSADRRRKPPKFISLTHTHTHTLSYPVNPI